MEHIKLELGHNNKGSMLSGPEVDMLQSHMDTYSTIFLNVFCRLYVNECVKEYLFKKIFLQLNGEYAYIQLGLFWRTHRDIILDTVKNELPNNTLLKINDNAPTSTELTLSSATRQELYNLIISYGLQQKLKIKMDSNKYRINSIKTFK